MQNKYPDYDIPYIFDIPCHMIYMCNMIWSISCFQCTFFVSNLKRCFQSNLFPMYVSNLHITKYYGLKKTQPLKRRRAESFEMINTWHNSKITYVRSISVKFQIMRKHIFVGNLEHLKS